MNAPPLPFSAAAERNREPIAQAMDRHLSRGARVLEFGAGSGQHACHIVGGRPDLHWLATDRAQALPGLKACIERAGLDGLGPPTLLDLLDPATQTEVPADSFDVCFAANVLHIAPLDACAALFGVAAHVLGTTGTLCVYGPVAQEGRHTGEGNLAFDASLRANDPAQGIRDIVMLDRWARATGFEAATLEPLPANNHLMVWARRTPPA